MLFILIGHLLSIINMHVNYLNGNTLRIFIFLYHFCIISFTLCLIFYKADTCNKEVYCFPVPVIDEKKIMLFLTHNLTLEKVDQLLMLCLSSSQLHRNMCI